MSKERIKQKSPDQSEGRVKHIVIRQPCLLRNDHQPQMVEKLFNDVGYEIDFLGCLICYEHEKVKIFIDRLRKNR